MRVYVLYLFFFFKQKTAYELRISDWSSDVCSSDLLPPAGRGSGAAGPAPAQRRCAAALLRDRPGAFPRRRTSPARPARGREGRSPAHRSGRSESDRKSVVKGKSVSVRVDLGGRGFI